MVVGTCEKCRVVTEIEPEQVFDRNGRPTDVICLCDDCRTTKFIQFYDAQQNLPDDEEPQEKW